MICQVRHNLRAYKKFKNIIVIHLITKKKQTKNLQEIHNTHKIIRKYCYKYDILIVVYHP